MSFIQGIDLIKKVEDFLLAEQNEEVALFASKLITTKSTIYGVKLPKLRQFAKKLTDDERIAYLNIDLSGKSYEEILLYGFVLGGQKLSYDEFLKYFYKYVPFVDNWSTCDSPISSMKIIAKHRKDFLVEIDTLLSSNENFQQRIAIVALLDFYISEEYLDIIFNYCEKIRSYDYYVSMAKAWLLSVCFVKFKAETYDYLLNGMLDDVTLNKTISKICDSYRVDDKDKRRVRLLKR